MQELESQLKSEHAQGISTHQERRKQALVPLLPRWMVPCHYLAIQPVTVVTSIIHQLLISGMGIYQTQTLHWQLLQHMGTPNNKVGYHRKEDTKGYTVDHHVRGCLHPPQQIWPKQVPDHCQHSNQKGQF